MQLCITSTAWQFGHSHFTGKWLCFTVTHFLIMWQRHCGIITGGRLWIFISQILWIYRKSVYVCVILCPQTDELVFLTTLCFKAGWNSVHLVSVMKSLQPCLPAQVLVFFNVELNRKTLVVRLLMTLTNLTVKSRSSQPVILIITLTVKELHRHTTTVTLYTWLLWLLLVSFLVYIDRRDCLFYSVPVTNIGWLDEIWWWLLVKSSISYQCK